MRYVVVIGLYQSRFTIILTMSIMGNVGRTDEEQGIIKKARVLVVPTIGYVVW